MFFRKRKSNVTLHRASGLRPKHASTRALRLVVGRISEPLPAPVV